MAVPFQPATYLPGDRDEEENGEAPTSKTSGEIKHKQKMAPRSLALAQPKLTLSEFYRKEMNFENIVRLHRAVRDNDYKAVQCLLDQGADINFANKDGKTALDIAIDLGTEEGEKIVKLLKARCGKQSLKKVPLVLPVSPIVPTNISLGQYKFKKRANALDASEHVYMTKLLSLVFFRASINTNIGQFHLGSNINNTGDLNDLCFRYELDHDDVVVFLQVINKQDTDEGKISLEDMRKVNSDVCLKKYFGSYLKIRQKFKVNNTDYFFHGQYRDMKRYFVLHTTLHADLNDQISVVDKKMKTSKTSKTVEYLINTSKKSNIFQYKYDKRDVNSLTKTIEKERLELVGKMLFQFIQTDKKVYYELMMGDGLIRSYNFILAQKVLSISREEGSTHQIGKFRDAFLSSNEEFLIALRETLYCEVLKAELSKDEINAGLHSILNKPSFHNIKKLIGNTVQYNKRSKRLEIVKDKIKLVDVVLQRCLSELRVPHNVAREAMESVGNEKLKCMHFKLPSSFGTNDVIIKESKVEQRLDHLAAKIEEIINNSKSKNVVIDDRIVGTDKILQPGFMQVNGGIGGAVGNLLIFDDKSKSLKFNMNDKSLPTNAKILLEKLRSRIVDLESIRLQINIAGFPRASLEADEYEESLAKDFLNNLWFLTDQAEEHEIDKIMTEEILKHGLK